ncbi:ABC transporter permease [Nocardioides sp.]|uniref:ABC transporter permease n=1 Tax=Nocardioides sp. TaxID=35761 RepID=UPI0039E48528
MTLAATVATTGIDAPRRRIRWPLSRRYLLGRLLNAAIAVWAVLTIVFFALHLTGNPAVLLISPDASKGEIERITAQLGLDKPLLQQYAVFLREIAGGHFPESIRYGTDPVGLVLGRLPATLRLGVTGLIGGVALGLAAGWYAAGRGGRLRRVPVTVLTAFEAVPSFFLSVVLIAVFAITWPVLPIAGDQTASSLVLPAAVIALALAAPIARVFRTSLQDTLDADHVRLAEAKGLSRRAVTLRHVVVNSLAPVVNVIGVQAGVVLGGAVVTESVFGWPGVGQLATSAISSRDYPVVLASVTLIAIGFVLVNLLVDIVAALLDPRGGRR